MGWYATSQAIKNGNGPYGTVAQSLKDESDPNRTLSVALRQVKEQISSGFYTPDKKAKLRISHWGKRAR